MFSSYISTAEIRLPSISTRTGDEGETSLLYGGRVSKADRRLVACGVGDEAVAVLGIARAQCQDEWLSSQLLEMQRLLFFVNAELATSYDQRSKLVEHFQTIGPEHTKELDDLLAVLESRTTLSKSFIIPGSSAPSASLDFARTVVRRLEREAVGLKDDDELHNVEILHWLNRLSDCLFMMARYVDRDLPEEAVTGTRREQ